jgi:hypothetical protein
MDSFGGFGGAIVVSTFGDAIPRQGTPGKAEPKQESPRPGGESWPTAEQLLGLSNDELGQVDPVVMNLAVAKGIPSLASLDIGHYVRLPISGQRKYANVCRPARPTSTEIPRGGKITSISPGSVR